MIYTLENEILKVDVNTLGAELQSIYRKDLNISYLWHGDAKFWARKSPVLFPIVGRLKNDSYMYNNEKYSMSQHGFARDKEFSLLHQNDSNMTFELTYSDDTLKVYPFLFQLQCTYSIHNESINVSYSIKNLDIENDMYYSIGAHPAFSTKLCKDDYFDDYTISFVGKEEFEQYTLDGSYLINEPSKKVLNPKIKLTRECFNIDTIIYKTPIQPVEMTLKNKYNHGITMSFTNSQFIGVWSPYTKDAPFVCLEPWQGISDTTSHNSQFSQKLAIHHLKPQQSSTFSYQIAVF